MKKYLIAAVAAVSTLALATAASATVTFDPTTGIGFVGKGDVQAAFGWNNATLQAQASNVTFELESTDVYDVTIQFDTGVNNITHHTVVQHKSASVDAAVAGEP